MILCAVIVRGLALQGQSREYCYVSFAADWLVQRPELPGLLPVRQWYRRRLAAPLPGLPLPGLLQ